MKFHRRLLLGGAAAMATGLAASGAGKTYRIRTADADIEMGLEFHDRYSSRGFWFSEESSNRLFCLSADGTPGRNCVSGFRGSIAIARYRVRARNRAQTEVAMREYVRVVDRDPSLPDRPPFERSIVLNEGIGSDLQIFGYEPARDNEGPPERHGPWYLFRQDLYLGPQPAPFLSLYWKHAWPAIRVLDLIPGNQTRVDAK